MKIKNYKCKCGSDDFGFITQSNTIHRVVGIHCKKCGRWLKWADKNEKNLMLLNREDRI